MLRETYWTKPVRVETAGRFRVISSTRAAAQWLLYHWPTEGGSEHRAARVACIAVLKNEQPPDHVRWAFIAAAKEAGILIGPDIPG
jgi:Protein of unknown function (DUF982)